MNSPSRLSPAPPPSDVDRLSPIALSWDTAEASTAYELTIEENTVGATVKWLQSDGTLSTSQVVNVSSSTSATIAASALSPSTAGYKWRVRYRNASNTWSPWSYYSRLSVAVSPPTCSVTSPVSSTGSNHTKVTWSYSSPGGYSQSAFRVRQYLSGLAVFDSGEVAGTGASYVIDGYTNSSWTNYQVGVMVKDSKGLWSGESVTSPFLVTVTLPVVPSISLSTDANNFVTVTVTASPLGKAVTSHDLYRWNPMRYEYVLLSSANPATFSYTDNAAPHNGAFWYKVVSRCDDGTSGEFASYSLTLVDDDWYLVSGTTRVRVIGEDFSADYDQPVERFEPLGRKREVVTHFLAEGREGTLAVVVTPDERNDTIRSIISMLAATAPVYLKSPYGDVLSVRLGSISTEDGAGGLVTIQIPFTEVSEA